MHTLNLKNGTRCTFENKCKTIMEYNQKADNKLPQSLVIVPLLCEWDNDALKLLRNIANKGRAADIHIAVGSADGKLPSALTGNYVGGVSVHFRCI
jgi:hypothetical protein